MPYETEHGIQRHQYARQPGKQLLQRVEHRLANAESAPFRSCLAANYTWSHSPDNLSSTFGDSLQGGSGYIGSLGYTDLAHPLLDWGNSDFDLRHRISIAPIWNTPWFKQGNHAQREVFGGWSLSGIVTARSGAPFSVFDETTVEVGYTIPRLIPATTPTYKVGSPKAVGPNDFNALTIPLPAFDHSLNPTLGMSDLGPFPSNMTHATHSGDLGRGTPTLHWTETFPVHRADVSVAVPR